MTGNNNKNNNNSHLDNTVAEGFDFLLSHLDHQISLWPRAISTTTTQAKQLVVNSREEAIARFKQANYYDCRISAYPYCRSDNCKRNVLLPPDFIMIDLDVCNFDYDDEMLASVLRQTLSKVKRVLQYKPTVIWSGNGYHIYIPIDVHVVLENIKELSNVDQVSTKFIRFAEHYLSNSKSDPAHNNSVSVNNCMLRIPGSINSNLKLKLTCSGDNNHHHCQRSLVKIVKRCSQVSRPHINLLVGSFYAHLTQEQINESRYRKVITIPTSYQSQSQLQLSLDRKIIGNSNIRS